MLNLWKNKDKESFSLSQIRHLNPVKRNSEQIWKDDKNLAEDLASNDISFPVKAEDSNKTERHNDICSNVSWFE